MKFVIVAKMQYLKIINPQKTGIFILLVSLDLITKFFVFKYIDLYKFIKINQFLDFTHIHNFGVSFGLFSNIFTPSVLVIIAALVVCFVFYLLLNAKDNLEYWGLFLIITGAIANILDRLFNGYVIDFIYFHINQFYWPAFNLADIYISIGILMIIVNMIKNINKN